MRTQNIGFSKWTEDYIDLAFSLWGDKRVTRYICATGEFTEAEIISRLELEIRNNLIWYS